MKTKPAREMILAMVLCFLTVVVVIAHFIFTNFNLNLILWVILVIVFTALFATFYFAKMRQGVFYTFAAMFTINAIYHLINATYAFKTYDSTHVLESVCSLIYLICASTFFLSYLLFLSSTTLEIRKLYKVGVYGLYLSSGIMFVQLVVSVFACNEAVYPWSDLFRIAAFGIMFLLHGVICGGECVKNQFKFLREGN